MSVTVTVPKEYGYVVATTAATFFLGFWHGLRVAGFRKPTKLQHPIAYADSAQQSAASPEQKKDMYVFNCASRAHHNFLEVHPSVAISLLVSGVQYPLVATGLGAAWIVGRIIYAIGYTRRDKEGGKGRVTGFLLALIPQVGLWGLTAWSGIKLVL